MHDERMIGRPALRGEDASDRLRIAGVAAQTVYGFRRKGDEAAAPEHRYRMRNVAPDFNRHEMRHRRIISRA